MIRTYVSDGQGPTQAQLDEVKNAEKYPVVPDEDCPELSSAMEKAFRSAVVQRNRKNNRKNA